MSPLAALVLIALASFRAWRFAAKDAFPLVRVPRETLLRHTPELVEYMVRCAWCLGTLTTFAVTFAVDRYEHLPYPVLIAVAASALVGLVAQYDVAD